jgi:mono/diheme cytochrome c family protein
MSAHRTRIAWTAALLGLGLVTAAATHAADATNGRKLFDRWCEGCHGVITPLRTPLAGTYALQQRYQGSRPAVLAERKDLTPELIRTVVRNGLNVMPRTRKTEISDTELEDIVAYLRK